MAKSEIDTWRIENHCCAICFSRVLSRAAGDRERVYRCSGCGVEKAGHAPSVICACGFRLQGKVKLGLKCEQNIKVSPEFPQEIIAIQS